MKNRRTMIGRNVAIDFIDYADDVPAKVDTGADGSAVWASHIAIDDRHRLHFRLFDEASPHYTGREIVLNQFGAVKVRNSTGDMQIRYQARLSVRIAGRRIRANFTLADRSSQQFPVLIGRRTLKNKFIVDVAHEDFVVAPVKHRRLNKELNEDPQRFHQKYYEQPEGNEVTP